MIIDSHFDYGFTLWTLHGVEIFINIFAHIFILSDKSSLKFLFL